MAEDIGHFKVVLEAEVDKNIEKTLNKEFKKGTKTVTDDFQKQMEKAIEKSKAFFTKIMPASFFGIKSTSMSQPGAAYQSMTNKEHLQPLTQSPEEKKESAFNKDSTIKTLAVLTGIYYTLTTVPSILGGVLKMLGFGFLLILKPLADLLAMVLLPIVSMVLDFGLFLSELSGGGMGGMIVAALVGLILALGATIGVAAIGLALTNWIIGIISSLVLGKLATAGIATALTSVASTAIAGTSLVGLLGTIAIAAALTAIIILAIDALRVKSEESLLEYAYGINPESGKSYKFDPERPEQIGGTRHDVVGPLSGTTEIYNPTMVYDLPRMSPYNTKLPPDQINPPKSPTSNTNTQTTNVNINGIIDKQEIASLVKNAVDKAMQTRGSRVW